MYRKTIQTTAAVALLGLAGIAGAQDQNSNADAGSEVVARVNGEPVTRAEANAMVQQRGQKQKSLSEFNPGQQKQLVNRLVEVSLLAAEARERGLAEREAIAAQLNVSEDLTLARALLSELGQGQGQIAEEEVRKAYEEKYGSKEGKVEFKARHILVDKKSKAEDLIKQLDEGADFAKLAKEHSNGPSGKKGGDLGWFAPDEMVSVFADAVRNLDKGSYTNEPVKSQYGFHVVKLEDKRSGQQPSFESKRQELRRQLANQRITKVIDDLRSKADIRILMNDKSADGSADSSKATGSDE